LGFENQTVLVASSTCTGNKALEPLQRWDVGHEVKEISAQSSRAATASAELTTQQENLLTIKSADTGTYRKQTRKRSISAI